MPTIKIKEPSRLFEDQLPMIIDSFLQSWYTSVIKIEKMCEDSSFKETFFNTYKKDYINKFNFRDVTNNITTLCKNLEKIASSLSNYERRRITFRNPLPRIPKKEKIQIKENIDTELNTIKELLSKAKDKISTQMKDIKLNWQDPMQQKFSDNINYFLNCIDSLNLCCKQTQKQIQTTKR